MAIDFAKLKKMQSEARDKNYILADEQAEQQIFELISYYDIDLTFEIEGFLDEEFQKELAQMSDDEKKGSIGLKQIIKDIGHYVRMGVLSIERVENRLIIKHALIVPIGEDGADSQSLKDLDYGSVTPGITEKMSGLKEDKYTFSQRAEILMGYCSGKPKAVIDAMAVQDKKAARSVGILLLIAL